MEVSLLDVYRQQLYTQRRSHYIQNIFEAIRSHPPMQCQSQQKCSLPQQINGAILQLIRSKCCQPQAEVEDDDAILEMEEGLNLMQIIDQIQGRKITIEKGHSLIIEHAIASMDEFYLMLALEIMLLIPSFCYNSHLNLKIIQVAFQRLDFFQRSIIYELMAIHQGWAQLLSQDGRMHGIVAAIMEEAICSDQLYHLDIRREVMDKIIKKMDERSLEQYLNFGLFEKLIECGMLEQAEWCLGRELQQQMKQKLVEIWERHHDNIY